MNIIDKAVAFFDFEEKKQRRKREKLKKIIRKLASKAKGLKKRSKAEKSEKKRELLLKEYEVVKTLLKKSRRRLVALKEMREE